MKGRDLVVLGLPRGGVPVAFEVARELAAPLDVILVRKLRFPHQPELAMGAIGEGGVRIVNRDVVDMAGVDQQVFDALEQQERIELDRRAQLIRGTRPRIPVQGRIAVIVDDGIATGSTARAGAQVARAQGATRVVVATPVATPDVYKRLQEDADEVIVAMRPQPFLAIGQFYLDFSQLSDGQVTELLERANSVAGKPASATDPIDSGPSLIDREVEVATGPRQLPGRLTIPSGAHGTVVFAHGSGSSRHSPRNRLVSAALNQAGMGTLLFDLLTPSEELDRSNVFDIELLADRLVLATRWLRSVVAEGPVGFFGASTGAAAALWAAAELGSDLRAVVSRGGRPDLAWPRLADVRAATLLIVGSRDREVLKLNLA
ncbi:MAG: phosphoribosyltransferase family protein, partial [Acidimicrobiia bacterium]